MKPYLSALILLLNVASFNAYCAINKWVDDSGQVHYSDLAPPDDTEATTLGRTGAASGVAASDVPAPKTLAEREAELKKANKAKTEAAQQAAKKQEEADTKQKYCLDARNYLKSLEENQRITIYDANGEPSHLDDAARQQRIQETLDAINTNCK